MLKRSLVTLTTLAVLLVPSQLRPSALAQQPNASPPQASNTMVHFEGCLYTEQAVASKQAVMPTGTQTYVLINAKLIAGAVSEEEVAKTSYTVDKAEPELLRSLFGKRVGVTGRISKTDSRTRIEVVDLREISGGCPTIPGLT